MALSPAARAALEQFRSQQGGGPVAGGNGFHEDEDATSHLQRAPLGASESAYVPGGSALSGVLASKLNGENGSNGHANGNGSNGHSASGDGLQTPTVAATPEESASSFILNRHLFRPEQPKTCKESGISFRTLEALILKTIKQEGPQNENQLSEALKLSINVFREVLTSLHKRELLDTPQAMHFDLTNKGRELTSILERDDAYVGPAPVSFQAYCEMCQRQSKRERRVTMDEVERVFANYPMRPGLKNTLKEGFNSQRVMLFYGPPGNGKSLITDNLHRLLKDPVVLPYAFEFNGRVVQLFDPAFHKLREDLMRREEEESAGNVSTSGKPDRRWLISHPPLVTVGTEFKVSHFEIAFDGQYFAPPHVKANNGIFIFDDLGRQTEDHNMILNQFIYPLEQREAIIKFTGGSAMRAPFLERLFLSTNLNHEEILDDAFKRRLLYQVLVDRPTTELWQEIFRKEAVKHGVTPEFTQELSDLLVKWYKEDDRVIRACDPRNLLVMVDATLDDGQRAGDALDVKLFRDIYERYPAAFKRDAKFFVGAMDCEDMERPKPSD
jgi:predicted transcriptional regulator